MNHTDDDWVQQNGLVRVSISVGGAYFETTVHTLAAGGKKSLLYVMVVAEVPRQIREGCPIPSIFLDRSPIVFAQILEYLRATAIRPNASTQFGLQYAKCLHPIQLDALIDDSRFYCLGELERDLQHGRRVHQFSKEWKCSPTLPLRPLNSSSDLTEAALPANVSGVICIVFSDVYDCICVGCTLGCVTIFKRRPADSDSGFDLHTRFMAHLDIVNDVAISKDSLVTSSRDGSVCVWDLKVILAGAAALSLKATCVSLGVWELVVGAKYPGVSLSGDAMMQPRLEYMGDRRLQDHIAATLLEGELPTAPVASPPNRFIDPVQLTGYVIGKQWSAMLRWRRQVVSLCPTAGRCVPVKPGNVVAVFSCVVDVHTIATGDTAGMVRVWNTSPSDKSPSPRNNPTANIGNKRLRAAPLPVYLSGLQEVSNVRGEQDDEMSLLTQILTSRGSRQYATQYAMSKLPQPPAMEGNSTTAIHPSDSTAYIKVVDYIRGNNVSIGSPSLCAEASQRTLELNQAEVDELTANRVLYVDGGPPLPSPNQFMTVIPTVRVWCADGSFYLIRKVAVIPTWGSFGQKYVIVLQGAVKTIKAIHRAGDTVIAAAQRQAVSLISILQAAVISTVSDVAFGNPLRQVAMYSSPTRFLLLVGCWNGPGFVWDVSVPNKFQLMCEMACPNPPSDDSTPWISDVVIAGSHCLVSYDSGSICQVDLEDVINQFDNQDAPPPSEIGLRLAACVASASPEDESMLMATTMGRSIVYTIPSVVCTTTHDDVLRCFVTVGVASSTPSLVTGSFGGTLQIATPT